MSGGVCLVRRTRLLNPQVPKDKLVSLAKIAKYLLIRKNFADYLKETDVFFILTLINQGELHRKRKRHGTFRLFRVFRVQ